MMMMIIPLAVLFIPILVSVFAGEGVLYSWDDPNFAETVHVNQETWTVKSGWLNSGWFTVRSIIYFIDLVFDGRLLLSR